MEVAEEGGGEQKKGGKKSKKKKRKEVRSRVDVNTVHIGYSDNPVRVTLWLL